MPKGQRIARAEPSGRWERAHEHAAVARGGLRLRVVVNNQETESVTPLPSRSVLMRTSIEAPLPTVLPDPDAILRLQIEFVVGRDLVDLIPSIDIAYCIASIFSRRVRVGFELLTQRSFGLEFPPSLCEGQEKALFATQSANDDIALAFQGENVAVMPVESPTRDP